MPIPSPSTTCPKCAGQMEFGILADGNHQGALVRGPERVLEWIRGTPKKSWFNLAFKADGRDRLQVATLRCTSCSFVELYAPDPGDGAQL